jgi:hypothetical protein
MSNLLTRILFLSDNRFTLLLFAILIIKNVIHPIGTEWIDWVYDAGREFPNASSYFSYSIIPVLVAKLLQFPSYLVWWIIFGFLTALFYFTLAYQIKKLSGSEYKTWLVIFCAFPFVISPIYFLGHYDLITIAGGILAGLTKSKKIVFGGAVLAVGANAEQAIMTSLCLVLLAIGTKNGWHIKVASIWFGLSISTYLLFRIFLGSSDDGNRIHIIVNQISDVLINSAGKVHLIVFSVFGVGWIVLVRIFKHSKGNVPEILILFAAVIIPVLLSIVILDRTRIGVAVGTLPMVLLLRQFLESSRVLEIAKSGTSVKFLAILILCVPTVFIDSDGSLRLPYVELFTRIFA